MDNRASQTYSEHIRPLGPILLVLLVSFEEMLAGFSRAAKVVDHGCTGIDIETA
jgi:hypothetical protein